MIFRINWNENCVTQLDSSLHYSIINFVGAFEKVCQWYFGIAIIKRNIMKLIANKISQKMVITHKKELSIFTIAQNKLYGRFEEKKCSLFFKRNKNSMQHRKNESYNCKLHRVTNATEQGTRCCQKKKRKKLNILENSVNKD